MMTKAPDAARLTDASIFKIVVETDKVDPTLRSDQFRRVVRKAIADAATDKAYAAGVADTEAKRDAEWQDGYDHGQGHERAAAETLRPFSDQEVGVMVEPAKECIACGRPCLECAEDA